MRRPDFRIAGSASTPRSEDCADTGQTLGLDEQLGERRMREIGGLRAQHNLGVRGHLDFADLAA